jgi:hypothetical protein
MLLLVEAAAAAAAADIVLVVRWVRVVVMWRGFFKLAGLKLHFTIFVSFVTLFTHNSTMNNRPKVNEKEYQMISTL